MLNIFTVAFFGHRFVNNITKVESVLEKMMRKLIEEKEYIDFLVGRNGDFDQCVFSALVRTRRNYYNANSSHVLVLPYATAEFLNNEESFLNCYTDVEISSRAQSSHPKAAIQIRNREMVDRSDLIICYVNHKKGGAWQTVNYALKQGKTVINLSNMAQFNEK